MIRKRNSRRSLLWMAGFFLAVQLAGGWVLDNVFPIVRCPVAYNHFAVLDRMHAEGRSPDIVYLGSSRFNSCLHEGLMTRALRELTGDDDLLVMNGSGGGGDLITADFLLDGLLRRGARPRLVLVELLPETANHLNPFLSMQILRQLTWSDIPQYFGEICRTGYLSTLFQSRFVPLYVHRYRSCRLLAMRCGWPILGIDWGYPHRDWNGPWDQDVPIPNDVDSEALRLSRAALGRVRLGVQDYRVGGNSLAALERLLQRCRTHDIEVLFVAPPVSSVHRNEYTEPVETRFAELLERLRHTPGCQVLDARDRVPDTLFLDNHHANPHGMQYFTSRLCLETLAPYWCTRGASSRVAESR